VAGIVLSVGERSNLALHPSPICGQLSTTALTLATQSDQSVLRLLG
jgi:hypothetical protein